MLQQPEAENVYALGPCMICGCERYLRVVAVCDRAHLCLVLYSFNIKCNRGQKHFERAIWHKTQQTTHTLHKSLNYFCAC